MKSPYFRLVYRIFQNGLNSTKKTLIHLSEVANLQKPQQSCLNKIAEVSQFIFDQNIAQLQIKL